MDTGNLWQYRRDEPNDDYITDFESSKFKSRFTINTDNVGINMKITAPLINFWRTFEMSLINCETSLNLTMAANLVIFETDKATKFAITDAKPYVPILTLST